MTRFERCLVFTLREEGGYSNDPLDRGGSTYMGITQGTLDIARKHGWTRTEFVADLTFDEVRHIYEAGYWNPSRAHEFPAPLDLLLFDAYVNHRPSVAVSLIQAAVGSERDGKVGPKTVARAHEVNRVTAIERYCFEREQFFRRIVAGDHSQERFLRGWLNRVAHVKAAALLEVA